MCCGNSGSCASQRRSDRMPPATDRPTAGCGSGLANVDLDLLPPRPATGTALNAAIGGWRLRRSPAGVAHGRIAAELRFGVGETRVASMWSVVGQTAACCQSPTTVGSAAAPPCRGTDGATDLALAVPP